MLQKESRAIGAFLVEIQFKVLPTNGRALVLVHMVCGLSNIPEKSIYQSIF